MHVTLIWVNILLLPITVSYKSLSQQAVATQKHVVIPELGQGS